VIRAPPTPHRGTLLSVLLTITVASPAAVGPHGSADPQRDSLEVRQSLEQAQRDFEHLRRRYLPFTLAGGPSPCPERVGRFCTWPEDPDDDPDEHPPEHERTVAARQNLIRQLEAAAARLPGDGWITGQLVRYLLEAGHGAAAATAADGCRATSWWCNAVRGLVAHTRNDFSRADSVFGLALAEAPDDVRCGWTDLTVLLDADAVRFYRDLDCDARTTANHRVWWLADPLWLTPGNERRTAHYARAAYARIFEGTEVPHGIPWRDDNTELLLRFGVPERWEQTRARGASGRPSVIGHRSSRGRSFVPPGRYLDSLPRIGAQPWPLDGRRESFQPAYARRFSELAAQIAVFPRDDHAVIVTAFPIAPHPPAGGTNPARIKTAAFFSVAHDSVLSGWSAAEDSSVARLVLTTPLRPGILSIEMLGTPDSVAARLRRWLDPASGGPGLAISGLLLIRSDSVLPAVLEQAVSTMRGSAAFSPGERVSIFWEVYDPPLREPVRATLVVEQRDRGFLRRAVEWLGFGGREPPVKLEWTVTWPARTAAAPGAITLELPAGQEGTFLLTLSITTSSGSMAVSQREITVRDG
jgi:hypothetical protein